MDLICPECRGTLEVSARTATCLTHGGTYELLFDRETEKARPAPTATAPEAACANHPNAKAAYSCATCTKPVCAMCAFDVDGTQYCSDCAIERANTAAAAAATPDMKQCPSCGIFNQESNASCPQCGHLFGLLNLTPTRRPSVAAGMMCAQHTDVAAVATCRVCGKGVCSTCDFALPGGIHACPTCIESQNDQEVSPRRKRNAWIAIVIAVFTTLFLGLFLTGGAYLLFGVDGSNEAVNTLVGNLILWPAIAGLAFAFASFDRRLRNPGLIWTAVIWNCSIVGIFILLAIIGLTMG